MLAAPMHNRYYENDEGYLNALGTAVSLEYQAAVNNGLLLQIDAPVLAMERHLTFADKLIDLFLTFIENVVNQINNAIIGIPADRIRLHVCWGNYEGPHHLDVPLQDILPILLKANVGGIMLPCANPRYQHEINVLRDIPLRTNQHLIAGVVDTLTNLLSTRKSLLKGSSQQLKQ